MTDDSPMTSAPSSLPASTPGWVSWTHAGKSVGRVSPGGLEFHTTRNRRTHWSYKMGGYGIQRALLRDLVGKGVEVVVLTEVLDGAVQRFRVPAEWWLRCGTVAALTYVDGAQVFLLDRQLEKWRQ